MRTRKIKSLVAAGLGVLLISVVPTLAVSAEELVNDSGEQEITVTASADTMNQCGWYMDGVGETDFNLTGTGQYIGNEYDLSDTDENIDVYLSGTIDEDQTCSTYGNARGAKLNVTWSGTGFEGDLDGLDFTLEDSPLRIDYSSTCDPYWSTEPIELGGAFTLPLVAVSILGADVDSGYDPSGEDSFGPTFPNCTFSAAYSTAIPEGLTPGSYGESYTLTGPTVTTTLVLQDAPN
jgi:hypothetical protein